MPSWFLPLYRCLRLDAGARRRLQWWAVALLCVAPAAAWSPWRLGVVDGSSMNPTLKPGALFLYDRTYYAHHPVRAGDVVVLRHEGEVWVKRVYAVGGTRFLSLRSRLTDQVVYDPIRSSAAAYWVRLAGRSRVRRGRDYEVVPVRVPAGQLFVVGDGLVSRDSREFGPVSAEAVVGRVLPLPGRPLGSLPDWVELDTPRARTVVSRLALNTPAL